MMDDHDDNNQTVHWILLPACPFSQRPLKCAGAPVGMGGEERRKGMSDGNYGLLRAVLADDGPTVMTILDKQKPTSVGEWTMQSSQ